MGALSTEEQRAKRAAAQRRWRASKGARTNAPGARGRTPGVNVQPCGTPAAYRRHRKRGEDPCGPCREAYSKWNHEQYERRKASD